MAASSGFSSAAAILATLAQNNAAHLQGLPLLTASSTGEGGYPGTHALDKHAWLACYRRFTSAHADLPSADEVAARVRAHHQAETVPIAYCSLRYMAVSADHVKALLLDANAPVNLPAEAFEMHTCTFLTAFFPDDFDYFQPVTPGMTADTVTFTFPADLCLTTDEAHVPDLRLDVDAEQGWQSIATGQSLEVTYTVFGPKQWQWQSADEQVRSFAFTVTSVAGIPLPDQTMSLVTPPGYPSKGLSGPTGHAWVYYGSDKKGVKHTYITHPLVFSEGFPGNYKRDYLYNMTNQPFVPGKNLNPNYPRFIEQCNAQGFDVILLGYTDGTIDIVSNAGVVVDCVQQIIDQMKFHQLPLRLQVGGACMGGVVTRYALAWMEKNNLQHHTTLYYSADSPHSGCSVPASVLFLMAYVDSWMNTLIPYFPSLQSSNLMAAYEKLQKPSARQLMLYTVDEQTMEVNVPDPLRTTLLQAFISIGQFPTQPHRIGNSNGLPDGAGNSVPAGAAVVEISGGVALTMYAAVNNPNNTFLSVLFFEDYSWTGCTADFDSVPGSIMPFFITAASALDTSANYDYSAFVPTISALAVKNLDVYSQKDLHADLEAMPLVDSWLDEWIADTTNNRHVHLTTDIANFYINEFLKFM